MDLFTWTLFYAFVGTLLAERPVGVENLRVMEYSNSTGPYVGS